MAISKTENDELAEWHKLLEIISEAEEYLSRVCPDGTPQWIADDPNDPEVLNTPAGYYVGTRDDQYVPYARWTEYTNKATAEEWLQTGEWIKHARPNP